MNLGKLKKYLEGLPDDLPIKGMVRLSGSANWVDHVEFGMIVNGDKKFFNVEIILDKYNDYEKGIGGAK